MNIVENIADEIKIVDSLAKELQEMEINDNPLLKKMLTAINKLKTSVNTLTGIIGPISIDLFSSESEENEPNQKGFDFISLFHSIDSLMSIIRTKDVSGYFGQLFEKKYVITLHRGSKSSFGDNEKNIYFNYLKNNQPLILYLCLSNGMIIGIPFTKSPEIDEKGRLIFSYTKDQFIASIQMERQILKRRKYDMKDIDWKVIVDTKGEKIFSIDGIGSVTKDMEWIDDESNMTETFFNNLKNIQQVTGDEKIKYVKTIITTFFVDVDTHEINGKVEKRKSIEECQSLKSWKMLMDEMNDSIGYNKKQQNAQTKRKYDDKVLFIIPTVERFYASWLFYLVNSKENFKNLASFQTEKYFEYIYFPRYSSSNAFNWNHLFNCFKNSDEFNLYFCLSSGKVIGINIKHQPTINNTTLTFTTGNGTSLSSISLNEKDEIEAQPFFNFVENIITFDETNQVVLKIDNIGEVTKNGCWIDKFTEKGAQTYWGLSEIQKLSGKGNKKIIQSMMLMRIVDDKKKFISRFDNYHLDYKYDKPKFEEFKSKPIFKFTKEVVEMIRKQHEKSDLDPNQNVQTKKTIFKTEEEENYFYRNVNYLMNVCRTEQFGKMIALQMGVTRMELFTFHGDFWTTNFNTMMRKMAYRNQPFVLYFQTHNNFFFGITFQNQPVINEKGELNFSNDSKRLFIKVDNSVEMFDSLTFPKVPQLIVGGEESTFHLYIEGVCYIQKNWKLVYDSEEKTKNIFNKDVTAKELIPEPAQQSHPMIFQFFSSKTIPSNNPIGQVFKMQGLPCMHEIYLFNKQYYDKDEFKSKEPFFYPIKEDQENIDEDKILEIPDDGGWGDMTKEEWDQMRVDSRDMLRKFMDMGAFTDVCKPFMEDFLRDDKEPEKETQEFMNLMIHSLLSKANSSESPEEEKEKKKETNQQKQSTQQQKQTSQPQQKPIQQKQSTQQQKPNQQKKQQNYNDDDDDNLQSFFSDSKKEKEFYRTMNKVLNICRTEEVSGDIAKMMKMTHTELLPFNDNFWSMEFDELMNQIIQRKQPFVLYFLCDKNNYFGITIQNPPEINNQKDLIFRTEKERLIVVLDESIEMYHTFKMVNSPRIIIGGPQTPYNVYIDGIGCMKKNWEFVFEKVENQKKFIKNCNIISQIVPLQTKTIIPFLFQFFSSTTSSTNNQQNQIFNIKKLPSIHEVFFFLRKYYSSDEFTSKEPFYYSDYYESEEEDIENDEEEMKEEEEEENIEIDDEEEIEEISTEDWVNKNMQSRGVLREMFKMGLKNDPEIQKYNHIINSSPNGADEFLDDMIDTFLKERGDNPFGGNSKSNNQKKQTQKFQHKPSTQKPNTQQNKQQTQKTQPKQQPKQSQSQPKQMEKTNEIPKPKPQKQIDYTEEYTKWVMAEEVLKYCSDEFNKRYVLVTSIPAKMNDDKSTNYIIETHVKHHQPIMMFLGFNTGLLTGISITKSPSIDSKGSMTFTNESKRFILNCQSNDIDLLVKRYDSLNQQSKLVIHKQGDVLIDIEGVGKMMRNWKWIDAQTKPDMWYKGLNSVKELTGTDPNLHVNIIVFLTYKNTKNCDVPMYTCEQLMDCYTSNVPWRFMIKKQEDAFHEDLYTSSLTDFLPFNLRRDDSDDEVFSDEDDDDINSLFGMIGGMGMKKKWALLMITKACYVNYAEIILSTSDFAGSLMYSAGFRNSLAVNLGKYFIAWGHEETPQNKFVFAQTRLPFSMIFGFCNKNFFGVHVTQKPTYRNDGTMIYTLDEKSFFFHAHPQGDEIIFKKYPVKKNDLILTIYNDEHDMLFSIKGIGAMNKTLEWYNDSLFEGELISPDMTEENLFGKDKGPFVLSYQIMYYGNSKQ